MDIRWQPPKKMLLLQERLAETLDYSNDISEKYIRKQCGLKVTQMRSKLWYLQRQGLPRPKGIDKEVW
jgi:hypothetical protein